MPVQRMKEVSLDCHIMPANFMHINIIRKSVLFVILVISCFGFEGWSWVLIASIPDLCILLTFTNFTLKGISKGFSQLI